MSERTFPDGFLWGSAGAAHQTEGNNPNCDWWEHEHAPGTTAVEPSGLACNSYELFEEDWRLVAGSGQNAVRFSIEWARIEPSPGEFSGEAIDHYREVIGSARDLGLTTFVTLHHFTNPLWFARGGAWENEDSAATFGRYALTVGKSLGDLLEVVNTINEPQVVASAGYVVGYFPPRKTDLEVGQKVTANLIRAHAEAVEAIRRSTDARVGLPLSISHYLSLDDTDESIQFRDYVHRLMVGVYLEALSTGRVGGLPGGDVDVPHIGGTDDFIGIQYYSKFVADPAILTQPLEDLQESTRRRAKPGERVSQLGWVWHPEGMGKVIDEVAALGLPIYITENGVGTENDEERIEYVSLHLEQVHDAIGRGADVRGYFHWSYIDNFEWNEGYRPKFGLIAVDRKTFERIPKPSLSWYGGVAKANAL